LDEVRKAGLPQARADGSAGRLMSGRREDVTGGSASGRIRQPRVQSPAGPLSRTRPTRRSYRPRMPPEKWIGTTSVTSRPVVRIRVEASVFRIRLAAHTTTALNASLPRQKKVLDNQLPTSEATEAAGGASLDWNPGPSRRPSSTAPLSCLAGRRRTRCRRV